MEIFLTSVAFKHDCVDLIDKLFEIKNVTVFKKYYNSDYDRICTCMFVNEKTRNAIGLKIDLGYFPLSDTPNEPTISLILIDFKNIDRDSKDRDVLNAWSINFYDLIEVMSQVTS